MPKIICKICESDSFENLDGFYYCNVCGNKSQNVCDIELSDEEIATVDPEISSSPVKASKSKLKEELENRVEKNFSTYEVYNYLLKRQCDDLIRLGVDPKIKEVVLKLWIKYLQKLNVAFVNSDSDSVDLTNVKWKRDKNFFEIYHLELNYEKEQGNKQEKIEENIEYSYSFDTSNLENNLNFDNSEDNKMIIDPKSDEENDNESNFDSDQESNKNDNFSDEELNNSADLIHESQKNISFVKFEWVRMPHTLTLLNLGLLMIKSQFLLTDLIRFVYNGKVSYFNIDEVLPNNMEFVYLEDSSMFNVLSVPHAEFIRYLTSKLGHYLGIEEIELIELNKITNRFIIDLNLPNELVTIVDLMIEKQAPVQNLNFNKNEYENLEALALSYILVSIIILFIYDNYDNVKYLAKKNKDSIFIMENWIKCMQNRLKDVRREYFGCELEDVRTIDDLKSLKLVNYKQRHKLRTKAFIAQYRKKDIIATLNAPLESELESIENVMSNLELNNSLFFISKLDKNNLTDFASKSIEPYFNNEKLNIIGLDGFSSLNFKNFLKENIEPSYLRGRFMLGLKTSTFDWLLEAFKDISHAKNFLKMFDYVKKLLNKIK